MEQHLNDISMLADEAFGLSTDVCKLQRAWVDISPSLFHSVPASLSPSVLPSMTHLLVF